MKERKIVITFNDEDDAIKVKSIGGVSAFDIICGAFMLLRNVDKNDLGVAINFMKEGVNKFKKEEMECQ